MIMSNIIVPGRIPPPPEPPKRPKLTDELLDKVESEARQVLLSCSMQHVPAEHPLPRMSAGTLFLAQEVRKLRARIKELERRRRKQQRGSSDDSG